MKWLIFAALLLPLAGCMGCEPIIEVRHCLDHQCEPSKDAVALNWTAEHAEAWPEVDALLQKTAIAEHEHIHWTEAKENAFWADFGVTGDEKELIVFLDEERYRIRILTCQ